MWLIKLLKYLFGINPNMAREKFPIQGSGGGGLSAFKEIFVKESGTIEIPAGSSTTPVLLKKYQILPASGDIDIKLNYRIPSASLQARETSGGAGTVSVEVQESEDDVTYGNTLANTGSTSSATFVSLSIAQNNQLLQEATRYIRFVLVASDDVTTGEAKSISFTGLITVPAGWKIVKV